MEATTSSKESQSFPLEIQELITSANGSSTNFPISLCFEDWGQNPLANNATQKLNVKKKVSKKCISSSKKFLQKSLPTSFSQKNSIISSSLCQIQTSVNNEESKLEKVGDNCIPCEFCNKSFNILDYEFHIKTHMKPISQPGQKNETQNLSMNNKKAPPRSNSLTIPQDKEKNLKISPFSPPSELNHDTKENYEPLLIDQINLIPQLHYSTEGSIAQEQKFCAICLLDFCKNEPLTYLPCLHIYHKTCIDAWLLKQSLCPYCKTNVRLCLNE